MVAPKKTQKASSSFTSIRVIGKQAQKILERARASVGNSKQPLKKSTLPPLERHDELMIHLSVPSVVKATFSILAILIGAYLLYHLRDKLLLLLLAVFLAAVIDPSVQAMQRFGIPRGLGILVHYFAAMFLILFLFFSFIPIIAEQVQGISTILSVQVDAFLANPQIDFPLFTEDLNDRLTVFLQTTLQNLNITHFADALDQFSRSLSTAAQGSFRLAAQVAGSVLNFFLSLIIVLVLAFFIQLEKEGIVRWARGFFPARFRTYLDDKSEAVHTKIGQWARGQLLLMFSIFSLSLIALLILQMPYALTLAALAGVCEFIPAVGPFIAAVPAILIAFTQEGPVMGIVIACVYYVIQWCENNLLVPLIMKRAVGLSPIAILFAMMIGVSFANTLHPVLGIMLSVPSATIIAIFIDDYLWNIAA